MSVDHKQPAELRSSLGRVSLADRRASVEYSFCNAGEKKGFIASTPRIEGMADIGEGEKGFVAAMPRIEAIPDIDEGDRVSLQRRLASKAWLISHELSVRARHNTPAFLRPMEFIINSIGYKL